MIIAVLQVVLLVLIGSYFICTTLAHILTWYYFARNDHFYPLIGYEPPVSIIKPIKGVDQSARDNFRSFCEQEYSIDYELLFCIEEQSDPSVPIIKEIIEEYPSRNIRLIFSDPKDARSFGKLKNMIVGVEESSYEVIIFSDSDTRVPSTFLRETVACTKNPNIGLGFGVWAYEGSEDWAAALRSVSVNELVLRIAPLCLLHLFDGAVGTTMVVRREVIREIGGLEQFGWQITDDVPIARTIRKKGYQIHLLQQPARIVHSHDSFTRSWSHLHRWLVIIRRYWGGLFLVTNLVALSFWWSILYLIIALFQHRNISVAVALALAVLGTSLISTTAINIKFVHNRKLWSFLWVVLIQELLRLPLVIHSYLASEVVWRGRRFRVDSDGTTRLVETLSIEGNP